MTLLAFNTNEKTPQEQENSVSWDETSLINNFRILVGIPFGTIVFEGLRDIIFLSSVSSVDLRKKEFILIGGRKLWNYF